MKDLIAHSIRFRPIEPTDEPLLSAIYAGTRAGEMALLVHWPDSAKQAFLQQQFEAQRNHYFAYFPDAEYLIILYQDKEAGRLYLDQNTHEIRIIDIALLPEFRGMGIGGHILLEVQKMAAAARKPITIHVERQNPALRLYVRLGFQIIDDSNAIYLLMEWRPQNDPQPIR